MLAGVVDIATEATGCHACLIYLLEGDRLVLRAASPVHRELVGTIEMGLGEGVTGWVARRNEAALIPAGALGDPRMKYFPELEEERWQSMAAVPIPSRSGEVIGVIVLHTAAPREFTEEDVGLLTHTATLVGGGDRGRAALRGGARARGGAHAARRGLAAARRGDAARAPARGRDGGRPRAAARRPLPAVPARAGRQRAAARRVRPARGARPAAAGRGAAARAAGARAPRRNGRDLWPGQEGAALLTTPLVASDEQLGLLCVLRPRRFGAGDEELLRALADQTAMGLERAELIARLTARDRVKDMFDALAGRASDSAVLGAAPAGCDLTRPHVFAARRAGRGDERRLGGGRDAARRAPARARPGRLLRRRPRRAARRRAAAERPRGRARDRGLRRGRGSAEHVVLGVSATGQGIAESRQALREAARAAQIARHAASPAAARSATSSSAPTSTSSTCSWRSRRATATGPRSRRCSNTTASAARRCSTRSRSTWRGAARSPTRRARSTSTRTRCASGSRGSSASRGCALETEDLLALELAVKLVRLDDARRRAGA